MGRLPGRVVAAHALASVGMSLPWPVLLVLVWQSTGDTGLLGLAGAARMLPVVLLSWTAGRLADRFARDRVVRWTLTGRLLALAACWVALSSGRLLLAVLAAALAVAFATPAYPALAAALPGVCADRERAGRATRLLVTAEVSAFVVGPALGGLLVAPRWQGWALPLSLVMVAGAAVLMRGVRLPRPHRPVLVGRSLKPLGTRRVPPVLEPVVAVLADRALLRVVLAMAALNGVLAGIGMALLPLAEVSWVEGATAFGMATTVVGLATVAGPLLPGPRGGRRRMVTSLLLCGVAGAAVAGTASLAWALPALALFGAASLQAEAAATELIQRHTRDDQRAGVLGLTDSVIVAAAMVGTAAAPALAALLGPRPLILVLGLALVAATSLLRAPSVLAPATAATLAPASSGTASQHR